MCNPIPSGAAFRFVFLKLLFVLLVRLFASRSSDSSDRVLRFTPVTTRGGILIPRILVLYTWMKMYDSFMRKHLGDSVYYEKICKLPIAINSFLYFRHLFYHGESFVYWLRCIKSPSRS